MSLQSDNLVMVGLGVKEDVPPNNLQPQLDDGIHLRWAFKKELGFPWYGFYLLRRLHRGGEPVHLATEFNNIDNQSLVIDGVGKFFSDANMNLPDDFDPAGQVEVDLSGRDYVRFEWDEAVRWVRPRIGFREAGHVRVKVFSKFSPSQTFKIADLILAGVAGEDKFLPDPIEFDLITSIQLEGEGTDAVLTDLAYVPISRDLGRGWEPVPGVPFPICLPITHPDYPCPAEDMENLDAAREQARERIHYGDPDKFAKSPDVEYGSGTVSVEYDSYIVTGTGTDWTKELTGKIFKITVRNTGYTIIKVLSSDQLLLSRSYQEANGVGLAYTIDDDSFGELYDFMVHLISGGPGDPAMHKRLFPQPVETAGTIQVDYGSDIVTGTGTDWDEHLIGLFLQVEGSEIAYKVDEVISTEELKLGLTYQGMDTAGANYSISNGMEDRNTEPEPIHSAGTVRINNDSKVVNGANTGWDESLEGLYLKLEGSERFYKIQNVNSEDQILDLATDYQSTDGTDATDVSYVISASPPTMPPQHPLETILFSSLNPAIAQMVGLYWIDHEVDENEEYDYLIVADHDGTFHDDQEILFDLIKNENLDAIDGYILFKKKMATAQTLSPPENLTAFALPGTTTKVEGDVVDQSYAAALTWDLGRSELGILASDTAIMYHLWRASLGNQVEPVAGGDYDFITEGSPILVGDSIVEPSDSNIPEPFWSLDLISSAFRAQMTRPSSWPPTSQPLHYIDSPVPEEGWYSYQINGIDIFGRHSANSGPCAWFQWDPVSDPRPWYYRDPSGNRQVELPGAELAVALLDKVPPPPPVGVEAFLLDPQDPMVLQDDAYQTWRQAVSEDAVGLRIRWRWTEAHREQAPDTREFRIYFQPGHLNSLVGFVQAVDHEVSDEESDILTDIPNTPANDYVGASFRAGSSSYEIVGSEAGDPLRLRIKRHRTHSQGSITADNGSFAISGDGTNWTAELIGLLLEVDDEPRIYTILNVDEDAQQIILSEIYGGPTGEGKSYRIYGNLPQTGMPCAIVIPGSVIEGMEVIQEAHELHSEYSVATNWQRRFHVNSYEDNYAEAVLPAVMSEGIQLQGSAATVTGNVVSLGNIVLPDGEIMPPDLSNVRVSVDQVLEERLYLENDSNVVDKSYKISAVDNVAKTITVDGEPDLTGSPTPWVIGTPIRQYEVILSTEDPGVDEALSAINPAGDNPIAYANVGVSAADDKEHTNDEPVWGAPGRGGNGGRYGNEGKVSSPAKIFQVLRTTPEPPVQLPFDDDEKIFASNPDYHSHSFYTFRWQPQDNMKTHLYRALDDALFKLDWFVRETQKAFDPEKPRHDNLFPKWTKDESGLPIREDWTEERKQAVADQLNAIDTQESYDTLTDDTWGVLANLPGNDGIGDRDELKERDWLVRTSRDSLSPDEEAHESYFPGDWNRTKREDFAVKLNNIDSQDKYNFDYLGNSGMLLIANLPGNERAFTQLTIEPLDPEDPKWVDKVGPDRNNPAPNYAPDPNLRAYVDTLDGRATNRYFYRASFANVAHTKGPMGLSTPPIWLRKVTPPKTPVVTKVIGGDREITLSWTTNREPDLAEYRIYRADDEDDARDLRLMNMVHSEAVTEPDPSARPLRVTWIDTPVPGLVTFYYRIVTVDNAGNISEPSAAFAVRAYDNSRPTPPVWEANNPVDEGLELNWTLDEPSQRPLVQRFDPWKYPPRWENITSWLPAGTEQTIDTTRVSDGIYRYRIRVLDDEGRTNRDFNELEV